MIDLDAMFGELRSLWSQTPAQARFEAMCAIVERAWEQAPGRVEREVMPALERHVSAWPWTTRALPVGWLWRWLQDDLPDAFVGLGRIVHLRGYPLDADEMYRLRELCAWLRPQGLSLSDAAIPLDQTLTLLRGDFVTELEHLGLAHNDYGPSIARALAHLELPSLRWLNLSGDKLQEEGGLVLAGAPWLEGLEALHLPNCELTSDAISTMAPRLRSAHSLNLFGNDVHGALDALTEDDALPHLRSLSLGPRLRDEDVPQIAEAPWRPLELSLSGAFEDLRPLARTQLLARTTRLSLYAQVAPATLLEELGQRQGAPALRSLRVINACAPEAFAALDACAHWSALDTIKLRAPRTNDTPLTQLLPTAPWLAQLTHLTLDRIPITADAPFLRTLQHLSIDDGPRPLVASIMKQLATLRHLALSQTEIEAEALALLPETLEALHLQHMNVDASVLFEVRLPALRALTFNPSSHTTLTEPDRLPSLAQLHQLTLPGQGIQGAALRALLGALGPELRELSLTRNRLLDEDAESIADAHWPRLRVCNLTGNNIGDMGAMVLASASGLRRLRHLHLRDNEIGRLGADALSGSQHLNWRICEECRRWRPW